MLKFGVIAEGPTDQTVIENILLGYFEDQAGEPFVQYVQPPRPLTETPGGWGHVFKSLERKDHEGALQFNDYLVIHIDTDVQEEPGFDVPKREGGKELSVPERVNRVIERLKSYIERGVLSRPVSTESCSPWQSIRSSAGSFRCSTMTKKQRRRLGVLNTANRALRKANQNALSGRKNAFLPAYEKASSGYRKRKILIKFRNSNPSLELFIEQLDALQSRLSCDSTAHENPTLG